MKIQTHSLLRLSAFSQTLGMYETTKIQNSKGTFNNNWYQIEIDY